MNLYIKALLLILVCSCASHRLNRFSSKILNSFDNKVQESQLKFQGEPLEWQNTSQLNDSNIDLVEGDILVERRAQIKGRKIILSMSGETTRWPLGIVPYEIDRLLNKDMVTRIQLAIVHWHENTCIRFELFNRTRHRLHKSRIIFKQSNICGAFVGYKIDMAISQVFLSRQCQLGTVIHELGHVIGFRHEHSRVDRDEHVQIDLNRFDSLLLKDQYDKMSNPHGDYFRVPYDLYSIMHYSSQNGVIRALDKQREFLMGQRLALSFLDLKLANLAYECGKRCAVQLQCLNEGFLNEKCVCVCPDAFDGLTCDRFVNKIKEEKLLSFDKLNLSCDFSSFNTCFWSQESTHATDDWSLSSSSLTHSLLTDTQVFLNELNDDDSRLSTGPQSSDMKSYVYLSSLRRQVVLNANAILTSPKFVVNEEAFMCLEFSYHMFTSQIGKVNPKYPLKMGKLSLYLVTQFSFVELWSRNGSQGKEWLHERVQIRVQPSTSENQIYFEAELDGNNYGDIALANIVSKMNKCDLNIDLKSQWSEWSSWSNCSCEQEYNYRVRVCTLRERRLCDGPEVEYKRCTCLKRSRIDEQVSCGGQFNLTLKKRQLIINSPSYPKQYPSNLKCNYLIKSPENTRVALSIVDLDLQVSLKKICLDFIEIRYFSYGQPGPSYCGTISNRVSPVEITSFKNYILILFNSDWISNGTHRGFSLKASLILNLNKRN